MTGRDPLSYPERAKHTSVFAQIACHRPPDPDRIPLSGVTQILESSQTLLQVLKRESVNLQKKRQTSN